MKNTLSIKITLLLLFIVFIKANAQRSNPSFKFFEESYGIYTSHTVEKEAIDGSASISHSVVEKQVLVEQTDKVPAKLGIQFGTVYKLTGKDKQNARLEVEWIFPHEIIDSAKNSKYLNIRYPIDLPINFENSSCYTLDSNFEVVKGTWIVNIYSDNKIIFTRKFDLY